MDTQQVNLVQETFILLSNEAQSVAATFYQRLFEQSPSIRALFSTEPKMQQAKFMHTLSVIVWSLHRSEKFEPIVQELGRSHHAYHIQAEHYPLVRDALLWSFQQHLGEQFTPAVKQAWQAAYDFIAQAMLKA